MKKTDYEYWKNGERVYKLPWTIKHYQNITDINQYHMGKKAYDKNIWITIVICLICGIWIGNMIWG